MTGPYKATNKLTLQNPLHTVCITAQSPCWNKSCLEGEITCKISKKGHSMIKWVELIVLVGWVAVGGADSAGGMGGIGWS